MGLPIQTFRIDIIGNAVYIKLTTSDGGVQIPTITDFAKASTVVSVLTGPNPEYNPANGVISCKLTRDGVPLLATVNDANTKSSIAAIKSAAGITELTRGEAATNKPDLDEPAEPHDGDESQ